MGTIQQAINQSAQVGAMLYSQSPSAQIRKQEKAEAQEIKGLERNLGKLEEPIGHGFGEMPEKDVYEAIKVRDKELTERETYNDITNPMNTRLYTLTGDTKYVEALHHNKRMQQSSQENLETARLSRKIAEGAQNRANSQYNLYKDLRELRITKEPLFKDFKGGKK